jgi:hypothetical protein
MHDSRLHLTAFVSAQFLTLVSISGCSNSVESQVAAMNDSHIKQVTNLYFAYSSAHFGGLPKDEASLKSFVKEMSPHKLELMHIDPNKLDEIFTSQRDGKPLKIKPSVGSPPAVVFETEGRNGIREVGFLGPTVKLVDNTEYDKLWNEKGSARAAAGPPSAAEPPAK